jgi:UDP-N-acetylmuramyl tripeptide synthase
MTTGPADAVLAEVWRDGNIQERLDAVLGVLADPLAAPWRSSRPSAAHLAHTKLTLARAALGVSRARGHGGTTRPGRLLLRLAPDAIGRLAGRLESGSALVGGTNGKTTTAAMLAGILRAAGRTPVHNRAGANLHWGVATALLEQRGDVGVFEVDEAWLPLVAAELGPRVIVLGNLFRDRLDAYGEVERVAECWASMATSLGPAGRLVLNADDPLVAHLGRPGTSYFGVADPSVALAGPEHAIDAQRCRRCQAPYRFERFFLGHLGHYRCSGCGARRPDPDVVATAVHLDGIAGSSISIRFPAGELQVRLPLPGLYNVYNALAATAAALALGAPPTAVRDGLESMQPVFGRAESLQVEGKRVMVLLMKNPAGANELLRTLERDAPDGGLDLWIAINDRVPDGRDVSWIWDVDFESVRGAVRRVVCSGTRAPEIALRLKYAGWPEQAIHVDAGIGPSFAAALSYAEGRLFALPTYTAMLELRTFMTRIGVAGDYWA